MLKKELKLPSKDKKGFYSLTIAASIGILLVTPVLSLLVIGYFLDLWLHTSPTCMITGIVIGFLSSLVNINKLLKTIKNN